MAAVGWGFDAVSPSYQLGMISEAIAIERYPRVRPNIRRSALGPPAREQAAR
jgi:hypothetical protein